VGDYIESYSYNAPSGMVAREMQYVPEGRGFLCVNGKNRYTRALYGTRSEYRIETSDMPIFALYKSKNYRNLRFFIDGIPLDSVQYCEARYVDGRRDYILKDTRWGENAKVRIECVPDIAKDGGFWKFDVEGFKTKKCFLRAILSPIANPKLKRNGDMGADKAGSFESDGTIDSEYGISFTNELLLESHPVEKNHSIQSSNPNDNSFSASKRLFSNRSSQISFNTPDSLFNTIGSALYLAAMGAWEGTTWQHGAVGWRMPLPGWRAGYLGDILGLNDCTMLHFKAYAKSQVRDVPPTIDSPSQDSTLNLARAEKKWGTQMYSNGYICRNPNRNDQMHHYDMNLAYIDELLWHFQFDADTAFMRKMWPTIKLHLEWEKRNFDKDNDHLYDAYCCIWASDALYYNGGKVTHSSAYNYRGNLLAAKIATLIGEDPTPYQNEADAILEAMKRELWVDGHWAEYKDVMGLQRVHPNAAVWSIYTPIDCGVGTPEMMYSCIDYIVKHIPHIPVEIKGLNNNDYIISTSDWMPYSWSINNVASAEIMHTALACFEAGRSDIGMQLVRGNMLDQMYLGASPGNFGQTSYYDAARGESYRDFTDNTGISSRTYTQGVFGIIPQALDGKCIIRPGFPLDWDSTEVKTPNLSYKYNKVGNKGTITITQNFFHPLKIVLRINGEKGHFTDYEGNDNEVQSFTFDIPKINYDDSQIATGNNAWERVLPSLANPLHGKGECTSLPLDIPFNANVTDIFRNQYLSPRPESTSLELPVQGIGEWCHPLFTVDINDSVFRSHSVEGKISIDSIEFKTPHVGKNIAFASLWDNYPDSIIIPVAHSPKASAAAILLAGSTNHMQAYMENAIIVATYKDGSTDTLTLIPPYNYCPIEQDYYVDGRAFRLPAEIAANRPLRISLSTGIVSRNLGTEMHIPPTEVYGRELQGGAAQLLYLPLNPTKKLKQFTLRCLSNDIVVGIMGITLLRNK